MLRSLQLLVTRGSAYQKNEKYSVELENNFFVNIKIPKAVFKQNIFAVSTYSTHEDQSQNDTRKCRKGLCVARVHTKTQQHYWVLCHLIVGSFEITHTLCKTPLDEGSARRREDWPTISVRDTQGDQNVSVHLMITV
jgi:hypothetical protein